MPSEQVLRYSALGLGVVYGHVHQRSIWAKQHAEAARRDYRHKQELIEQARKTYAQSKQPASAKATTTGGCEFG
jgi:F-type H+-transporting ATP synthase subunit e